MTDARLARISTRVLTAGTPQARLARISPRVLVRAVVARAAGSTSVDFTATAAGLPSAMGSGTTAVQLTPTARGIRVTAPEDIDSRIVSGRPEDWPAEGVMHFRLTEPRLGSLDLTCDTGYVVRSYEFGFPEIREVTFPNSLDDGTYDFTRYIGARSVSLDIVLRPTESPGSQHDVRIEAAMRDALLRFLHPWSRPRLLFSEHGDTRVRFFNLRGSDAPITVSQPRFNEISASWRAPRGLIESLDVIYARLVFLEELRQSYVIAINNPGTAPSHWSIHIEGELAHPRFTLNDTEKLSVTYDLTSGTGAVDIDSLTRSVFIGGAPLGYRYVADESTWFMIPPGRSTLTITHETVARLGYPFAHWQTDSQGAVWTVEDVVLHDATPRLLPTAGTFADLAALKASATYGDGHYTVPSYATYDPAHASFQDAYSQTGGFLPGDFVRLGDDSQAWYDPVAAQWRDGPMETINLPAPEGAPPWAWSISVDPKTGEPPMSELIFYLHPAWI